jgi:hypothetical protein
MCGLNAAPYLKVSFVLIQGIIFLGLRNWYKGSAQSPDIHLTFDDVQRSILQCFIKQNVEDEDIAANLRVTSNTTKRRAASAEHNSTPSKRARYE